VLTATQRPALLTEPIACESGTRRQRTCETRLRSISIHLLPSRAQTRRQSVSQNSIEILILGKCSTIEVLSRQSKALSFCLRICLHLVRRYCHQCKSCSLLSNEDRHFLCIPKCESPEMTRVSQLATIRLATSTQTVITWSGENRIHCSTFSRPCVRRLCHSKTGQTLGCLAFPTFNMPHCQLAARNRPYLERYL